jgi:hypothetical protein
LKERVNWGQNEVISVGLGPIPLESLYEEDSGSHVRTQKELSLCKLRGQVSEEVSPANITVLNSTLQIQNCEAMPFCCLTAVYDILF